MTFAAIDLELNDVQKNSEAESAASTSGPRSGCATDFRSNPRHPADLSVRDTTEGPEGATAWSTSAFPGRTDAPVGIDGWVL
ncbi:hypothetical protein GCM10010510_62330 [Streptomyces anandii JCM 4720]|nr:hypothetical protein GCM10010510_62330 [Streptomyces anandii JCM 4720]